MGSGLLGLPGLALEAGGLTATAAGWIITTLASLPLIYILMRLGMRFSSSAGLARYAQAGVGDWSGAGVTTVLVGTFALCIPALTLIGGCYAQRLFGLEAEHRYWLAAAVLGLATVLNSLGARWAGAVSTVSLVALAAMVAYIVLTRSADGLTGATAMCDILWNPAGLEYAGVWSVCAILFWAYIGWENLSFGLDEFRNPSRSIPLVYWGSFAVVVVLYLSLAAVTIGAAASGVTITGPAGLVELVSGSVFGLVLTGIMLLVILANANAWVFGASRLVYSAGRQQLLPAYLGQLSRRQVPLHSLWTMLIVYLAVIVIVGAGIVRLDTLIALVSQNFLVLYAFSIVAFLRTETQWHRWPIAGLATLCVRLLPFRVRLVDPLPRRAVIHRLRSPPLAVSGPAPLTAGSGQGMPGRKQVTCNRSPPAQGLGA